MAPGLKSLMTPPQHPDQLDQDLGLGTPEAAFLNISQVII